jgi:hypothetical protein
MADENAQVSASAPKTGLKSSHLLDRFDSGILFGIVGVIGGGVAQALGFVPATIGTYGTPLAVGTVLFLAEWIRGIKGQ